MLERLQFKTNHPPITANLLLVFALVVVLLLLGICPQIETFDPFRDFRKSMKMCKMNTFSLICKSGLFLFLTSIMAL